MYSNILVPVSLDEEHDHREAIAVARDLLADGGRMTLLHVMEQIPTYAMAHFPPEVLVQGRKSLEERMQALNESMTGPGEAAVIEGPAGPSIVDYAEDKGCDCIVMRSHRPELSDYLLGSTAGRVVRHAACSVHVVR